MIRTMKRGRVRPSGPRPPPPLPSTGRKETMTVKEILEALKTVKTVRVKVEYVRGHYTHIDVTKTGVRLVFRGCPDSEPAKAVIAGDVLYIG